MKILYIDFSGGAEHLILNPTRYGGGRIVPTYLRENLDNFYTAGLAESFTGIGSKEKWDRCIVLDKGQIFQLRNGEKLENIIADKFDLLLTSSPDLYVNTEIPQLVWCVGYKEKVNPAHKNVLLHNLYNQYPVFYSKPTVYGFRLGINIPEFQEYKKEDIVFQCTNHSHFLQSIITAQLCQQYKIRCILAGPISENYPLLQYIDNYYVKYIGQISEETKIELSKKSKVHTLLFSNFINECPLSGKIALAYGNQIFSTPIGDMPNKIKEGVNGKFIVYEEDFINGWNNRDCISQRECYDSIKEYSVENMVLDINKIFQEILNEN